TMVEALSLAHEEIQKICVLLEEMREKIGKEKSEYTEEPVNEVLIDAVRERTQAEIRQIVAEYTDRSARKEVMTALHETLKSEYEVKNEVLAEGEDLVNLKEVKEAVEKVLTEEVRR